MPVRNLRGACPEVNGHEIEKILKLKSRDEAGETAPAHGLFLTKVEYPKNLLEPNWPMNLTI